MEKQTFNPAQLLTEHFGVYGKGNFDLSTFEINILLDILRKKGEDNVKEALKQYYELLEKQRMG